ncbi:MAG: cyanophycinase [Saprospirales bacterium]|nr:MAG: cyanophycinase [Saprospirales bacterium]
MNKSNIKGTLIPIGGNEDKGDEENDFNKLDFIEEGILAHVVRKCGGKSAHIAVVTAASGIPHKVGENYLQAFDTLGCDNISLIHISGRKDTDSKKNLKIISEVDGVMFSGGDQSKITAKIAGTQFHQIIAERYRNEEFVIAGTSAGAMAMSEEMIAGGSSRESFIKGAVIMDKGLNLISDLMIDTHFIRRGRFGRLAESVAKFPGKIGIGLAEDTGLIVKEGKKFVVIGSGMIIVFDGRNLMHNNEQILKQGTPMTMTNLVVHVLSNGDSYHIQDGKVDVLPVSSPFI